MVAPPNHRIRRPIPGTQPADEPHHHGNGEFVRGICNAKKGSAVLVFRVDGPGRFTTKAAPISELIKPGHNSDARYVAKVKQIKLRQRSIRAATTSAAGAGERVPLELTAIGKRLLTEHRLKVRVSVSFVTFDGSTTTWKGNVTLKKRPESEKRRESGTVARKMLASTFVLFV